MRGICNKDSNCISATKTEQCVCHFYTCSDDSCRLSSSGSADPTRSLLDDSGVSTMPENVERIDFGNNKGESNFSDKSISGNFTLSDVNAFENAIKPRTVFN